MITYLCKYTPLELLRALGLDTEEPNADEEDFRYADEWMHSSVCTHAKMLLEQIASAGAGENLILTNCCDSVRRVCDTVADRPFHYKTMLDLPHVVSAYTARMYAKELRRLMDDLASADETGALKNAEPGEPGCSFCFRGKFDRAYFIKEWKTQSQVFRELYGHGPFIAILGGRVSDQLRTRIRDAMPYPVIDLTCGGLRTLPEPPADALKKKSDGSWALSDDDLLAAYADALLRQIPCTRMDDVAARARLYRYPGLRGIVYHSVRFCDYYSFEYADIRESVDLPMLKIESDYTAQSEGQLDTRIRAFAESLPKEAESSGTASGENMNEFNGENVKTAEMKSDPEAVFIGIDSGSTSTNVAAIDQNGKMLASAVLRTGAKAGSAAERALQQVKNELGGRAKHIRKIVATGYGREFISFADETKTEISCHARGAHFAYPEARTVIDIGGQDSKVIRLDEGGNVTNFVMNDKCAAGTGRFLEMMAHTLEIDMDEMSRAGLKWKHDLTISSTCTVFAESEVVGLIAENAETGDIVHALDESVASKTCGMVKRVKGGAPYMMTGGVARNAGVVAEISRRLGEKLRIVDYPDLVGALGAALYARDA